MAVIRYGAGTARIRRPELQAHLEIGIGEALSAGWSLAWQAVRRRLNHEADELATAGRSEALRMLAQGRAEILTHVDWSLESHPLRALQAAGTPHAS